ncbi:hypothetical protein F5Y13DRAFT_127997 [Hypoxylon sp. FL1857]|nr:hypothetical protein F5Y13DRAFT_127997 [Hypoxylon sp. FL1857]
MYYCMLLFMLIDAWRRKWSTPTVELTNPAFMFTAPFYYCRQRRIQRWNCIARSDEYFLSKCFKPFGVDPEAS